ncbi:uncharacterized protein B0H18DRAFT_967503 [Fomitopsis serialis]|uniref:uncharacterized protein n=1 Tax=Fomitopsis serialis TaxID=139415 RepID=UPI0020071E00|nr:uncharacterized protein B0H18DRAFT_967503 [Neoantrodia serialis]KAH9938513.1 hypothetical protein B0H18DRAFT_967503 [Neoantrodia serialis]
MDVNIHHHDPAVQSKRTSIHELLNPVGPSTSLDQQYAQQLPSISHFMPQPHPHQHPQHVQAMPPPQYSPPMNSQPSFSLRTASWDQQATKDDLARRPETDPNACRFGHPSVPSHHQYYQETYPRSSRSVSETPSYGMDIPSWSTATEQANSPYPMYSNDRTDWQSGERASPLPPMTPSAHVGYTSVPFAIPFEQSDDESGAKSKKSRSMATASVSLNVNTNANAKVAKVPEGAAQSRRGYSAKKRSEAAQIAAQNAQLMPTVSYAHVSNEKGKEKAASNTVQGPMRIVGQDDTSQLETSGPLHPELQFARCMSNRYRSEEFPRCVSCTRRWAGDTCRFQGIRFFLKNDKKQIVGISFVESQKPDAPTMNFPNKWNILWTSLTLDVAQALLPTLKKELDHLSLSEVIRRPRESEVRATCDTCMTSIFSSSWMCCYEQARREKHAHINPSSCRVHANEHQAKDFSPMSLITEMEALLQETEQERTASTLQWSDPVPSSSVPDTRYITSAAYVDNLSNGVPPEPSSFAAGTKVPSHVTRYFADGELTDDIFCRIWARGEPIVVTGMLPKFHCQTDQNRRVTVGEFFSWFGRYEGRRDCWKLKDWPPSTDFRTAFPELYDDFANATPVPNYVRRDGVLNLASHFPGNTVAPDLGPKMYNAMASFESNGSKGSTRLHMDMADAVNVMLYAAPTPDGRPGCAAWDLFKAEDATKLRKYMRKKFKGQFQHDPIHSQQFYLDSELREELFKEYGVKSHRVLQKPGEAVFIPAGCAHQVCNLADCIKVASDFVSPENIERCEMLTREFREQNQSMAWKEDVLQLRTMMWFAWLSCTRQEKDADA